MPFTSFPNLIVKFGSLAVLLIYVVFAGVVVRQINLMVQTFSTPYEPQIKAFGWFHLGLAILVLLLAIVL